MPTEHVPFDVWFAQVKAIAKAGGWNIENPDEWRTYYSSGMSPKDAFEQEMS